MEHSIDKRNCYPRLSFSEKKLEPLCGWHMTEALSVILWFAKAELQRGVCTLQRDSSEMRALAIMKPRLRYRLANKLWKMSQATLKYLRAFHRLLVAQFVFFYFTWWIFTKQKWRLITHKKNQQNKKNGSYQSADIKPTPFPLLLPSRISSSYGLFYKALKI